MRKVIWRMRKRSFRGNRTGPGIPKFLLNRHGFFVSRVAIRKVYIFWKKQFLIYRRRISGNSFI